MINPDSFKGCIDDNYHTYFPIINQSPMCVFINYLQPKNVMIDCISNNFAACSMSYLPISRKTYCKQLSENKYFLQFCHKFSYYRFQATEFVFGELFHSQICCQ